MLKKDTKNFNKSSRPSPSKKNVNMLESLMKEINLNCKLQGEILHFAKSGLSLPYVPKELLTTTIKEEKFLKKNPSLPPRPIQRMKSEIVSSGAYERDSYRPYPSQTHHAEREKARLQNMMAFGRDLDDIEKCKPKHKKVQAIENSNDLFDEILNEIKERYDFLEEMSLLGQEKKYLPEIEFQISLRLKELEKIDKAKAEEAHHKYGSK